MLVMVDERVRRARSVSGVVRGFASTFTPIASTSLKFWTSSCRSASFLVSVWTWKINGFRRSHSTSCREVGPTIHHPNGVKLAHGPSVPRIGLFVSKISWVRMTSTPTRIPMGPSPVTRSKVDRFCHSRWIAVTSTKAWCTFRAPTENAAPTWKRNEHKLKETRSTICDRSLPFTVVICREWRGPLRSKAWYTLAQINVAWLPLSNSARVLILLRSFSIQTGTTASETTGRHTVFEVWPVSGARWLMLADGWELGSCGGGSYGKGFIAG